MKHFHYTILLALLSSACLSLVCLFNVWLLYFYCLMPFVAIELIRTFFGASTYTSIVACASVAVVTSLLILVCYGMTIMSSSSDGANIGVGFLLSTGLPFLQFFAGCMGWKFATWFRLS